METLRAVFSIERLAVVGGGNINGSMLDLGLIDEVSMMYGYGIISNNTHGRSACSMQPERQSN
jgi:riboflavin biosynthesis pyrimidine reductase